MRLGSSIVTAVVLVGSACTLTGTVGIIGGETETTIGSSDTGDRTDQPLIDLGVNENPSCIDRGDQMGVGTCTQKAPPDAFEASLRWAWIGPDGDTDSIVIPLVANLTDDDDNGRIDLCDRPDVVVVAGPPLSLPIRQGIPPARLYALDGLTGTTHWQSEQLVRSSVTPALGDIDGDGQVEIVTLAPGDDTGDNTGMLYPSRLVAFEPDGTVAWLSTEQFDAPWADAVALADLDNDGDVEIMVADRIFDHLGALSVRAPDVGIESHEPLMPFGVDLDEDGDLEVLWARAAIHHDGTLHYRVDEIVDGYAQVADLDRDGTPEIIITSSGGVTILDANGNPRVDTQRPRDPDDPDNPDLEIPNGPAWRRPAAIHDINGDRQPDLLMSAGIQLLAINLDLSAQATNILWHFRIDDAAGEAAGTAFDFLGDTTAEAIYADESMLYAFDAAGFFVLDTQRTSFTLQEYPVVADVDNDGSAEMVVVSNLGYDELEDPDPNPAPTVMVLGEANDRWVQARRIWNQHTYHVTNISEDGLVPMREAPHWLRTNTFRTNAQLEGGVICVPEP